MHVDFINRIALHFLKVCARKENFIAFNNW